METIIKKYFKMTKELETVCNVEKGKSTLTANRIDNSVGHEIDNADPMCCWCTCALTNR